MWMSEAKSNRDEVARAVQEALREAPFSLRDLAEDMDGSYGTVREWSRGARTPTDASVERIAASLERRARALLRIAERLKRVTRGA
jgi:transcriptional regulator with XRE-family HTH domain